jgi:multicomponent Na+:H+ antiporter subunit B
MWSEPNTGASPIVRTITRKLFPFILLFGGYLISHGHLSPGGGFQGGVVVGSALVLLGLSQGIQETRQRFSARRLVRTEHLALMVFVILCTAGWIRGYATFKALFPETIPSEGPIFLLNLAIGTKVGAAITLIFYALGEAKGVDA